MIVDGHAHVWTIDPAAHPWQPTFGIVPTEPAPPERLIAEMDAVGVDWAVLVQPSAYGRDHRFMARAIKLHPGRFVGVGLVDPADPDAVADAAGLVAEGFVGFRVNLALDLGQAEIQAKAATWRGLVNLGVPISLRATPAHHHLAKQLLRRHPNQRFVIDHLELPERADLGSSSDRLAELASFDNCWLKLAGPARFSEEPSPYRDTWPFIVGAVQSFASRRVLWGSDYPANGPGLDLPAIVAALASGLRTSASDQERILSGTAIELWGRPVGRDR